MSNITAVSVKALRDLSGAGLMDCKSALDEAEGDMDKEIDLLRTKGLSAATKKSGRTASEGLVCIKTEGTKGTLVEDNSETDFVARTSEFVSLAHDIALQVASMDPQCIDDEVNLDELDSSAGEPRLMYQPFVKDSSQTIKDLITEAVSKIGENILIKRFIRYELGES